MFTLVKCDLSALTARLGGIWCAEKRVTGMILLDRSIRIDPATFTSADLDELIQQDLVIGTIKLQKVEDANTDRTFTDLTAGKRIPATLGLKKWVATFYKGGRWQNEMDKLDNSERYSVVFVFEDGSILVKQLKDGTFKGYDLTLFTGIKNLFTGDEAAGSTLMMDLEPYEMKAWQSASAEYMPDDIDFNELAPIEEVSLIVPVLTAGATSTVIDIERAGASSPAIGLTDKLKWKMYRNGVAEVITNLSSVAGKYTFTHAALVAGDKITFQTESAGYPIYPIGSSYFIGASDEKTVV